MVCFEGKGSEEELERMVMEFRWIDGKGFIRRRRRKWGM